jgi:protein-S-isoprenylcysteine O-methyltransferase Ste14
VLSLLVVQVLGVCCFVGAIASISLGGPRRWLPREGGPVVARRNPGLWSEVTWAVGSAVSVFWPLGVVADPTYTYHWPPFPDFPASDAFQLLGLAVTIAGGVLFFAARRALGRHMTPAIQVRADHELVRNGPYRFIRHPVYTAIVASTLGLSLLFLSPILLGVAVVLVAMAIYRARLEEELLGSPQAFGSSYAEYAARTGRFLPRLRPKS